MNGGKKGRLARAREHEATIASLSRANGFLPKWTGLRVRLRSCQWTALTH